MPKRNDVLVIPRNQRWEVSFVGVTRRMIEWLCTRERAIAHALERAAEVGARRVVVEGRDGSVDEVVLVTRRAA